MKIYNNIEEFNISSKTILTIGTFDGLHEGHKRILEKLIKTAKNKGLQSVVLTFFPHPRKIINKDNEVKLIDTLDEKVSILKQIGVDSLIIHPFDKNFSLLTAYQFIKDYLVDRLKISHVIIGYDHRFGKGREASVKDLKEYGEEFDFIVEEIDAHEVESITVSSTKIRDSIIKGDLKSTKKFLGRHFRITGEVIEGDGIGKKINYPTANIFIKEDYKIIPKDGVYLIKSKIDNIEYYGMMNIGHRPTIGDNEKSIEVHLFNFNYNIYGNKISVDILSKIRDEKKFSSIEALKEQLKKDEALCLKLISK